MASSVTKYKHVTSPYHASGLSDTIINQLPTASSLIPEPLLPPSSSDGCVAEVTSRDSAVLIHHVTVRLVVLPARVVNV